MKTTTLYRPIGPEQLAHLKQRDFAAFPGEEMQQKFFYPLLHESFARRLALEWYLPQFGAAHIVSFDINSHYLEQFEVKRIGGPEHTEYRIPVTQIDRLNKQLLGKIQLLSSYQAGALNSAGQVITPVRSNFFHLAGQLSNSSLSCLA
ncbi:hypothetical protein [Zooshikella ganghwensis]|uniref:Uncharacterized protein n=1 Tax=Zooshikella ganghwensis TaxID=202772 RepID=A0A4P9VSX5_9GAMM|nr:hypothetical protein [Zooshikella ganghwensis]RDH45504.1 hypothetical protein B9G39_19770 [Zooshikella ganghwensis]